MKNDGSQRTVRMPDFEPPPRFEIVRRIGVGGMGVVYEAIDTVTGRRVALKTLRQVDPASVERHRRELRLIERLRHPNLVRMGELFETDGSLCFSMELVPGGDVLTYLGSPAERDDERVREVFLQLSEGLCALHAAGVVHRDIKPSNVLVTREGRVVLVDFGVAALMESSGTLTGSRVVGTADYMAPEQAGGARVGPAADWYSVGVLLYEVLTGQLPFYGDAVSVMRDKQLYEVRPPHTVARGIPHDLDELCTYLLRREPEERPTGEEACTMLRKHVRGERAGAPGGRPKEEPPRPSPAVIEVRGRAPADGDTPEGQGLVAGRYRLLRLLGSGGMARVHLAKDEIKGRLVALKMLHGRSAEDLSMVHRFQREARIMKELDSEYSVVIHDFGQAEDGSLYLAMEYLEGETLAELLAREEVLSPQRAGEVALAVLDALAAAHRRGVVHRDVKPGNIFLASPPGGGASAVKLLDFGVAKLSAQDATQLTAAGGVLGTPHFMSPEQARGRPVDARSDLYALGIVLYRALTGAMPFEGASAVEQLYAHVHSAPEPPTRRRPDLAIPPELSRVVLRAIQKEPEARYASARAMAADLRAALEEPREPGAKQTSRVVPWLVRGWILVTLLVAVAVVVEVPVILRRPFPGFAVESGLLVSLTVSPDWAGMQHGIEPYDVVLAADGRPMHRGREVYSHVEKLAPGTPVTYRILRGDREIDVVVPVSRLTPIDLALLYGPMVLTGLLFLAVGGVVAWRIPTSWPAQGVLAVSCSLGSILVSCIDLDLVDSFPWVWRLGLALTGPALIHLGLVFPKTRPVARGRPWVLAMPYFAGIALFSVWNWGPPSPALSDGCNRGGTALTLVGLVGLLGLLVDAAIRGGTLWARQSARLLLGMVAVGFSPSILGIAVPTALGMTTMTTGRLMTSLTVTMGLFPLTLAYQIRKQQLLDVDVALSSLWAGLLRAALLGAALLAPVAALGALVYVLGASPLAAILSAGVGVVVVLSTPLMPAVERLVRRRSDVDHEAVAQELAEATRDAGTAEEVLELLFEKLQRCFKPVTIRILERAAEGYRATGPKLRGRPAVLSDLRMTEEADTQGGPDAPVSPADVRAHLSRPGGWRAHLRLILPLHSAVTLSDDAPLEVVAVVGPRADGRPHSAGDAVLFAALLQVASMRIDALKKVQHIERRALIERCLGPKRAGAGDLDLGVPGRGVATAVVLRLRGIDPLAVTLRPDAFKALADRMVGTLMSIAFEHGGAVHSRTGDELLFSFGAVGTCEGRSEVAAVAAARAMVRAVRRTAEEQGLAGLGAKAGVAHGPVTVGAFGPAFRADCLILGAPVTEAARLAARAAPGEVAAAEGLADELASPRA